MSASSRWLVAGIVGLAPALAHGHSYLLSPPPRAVMTVRQGNPPCGGDARGSTPTVLSPGQVLQVQFREVQNHGNFAVYFSAANDQGFTLLANVANPPTGDNSVMVTLPSTPCDQCTLQLVQMNGASTANWYYSCADVSLGSAPPGSTTTTVAAAGPTTTSTTEPEDCAALDGFDAAECRLDDAATEPPCVDEGIDRALEVNLQAAFAKARQLVRLARSRTKPSQVARLVRKADRRLAKVVTKAARVAAARRISRGCEDSVAALVEELRAVLAALLPAG